MRILKITLAMLLAITMLFSLCACGFSIPNLDDIDTNDISVDDSKVDKDDKDDKNVEPGKFDETTIELEDCKIVVLGAEKTVDSDEKSALRIWFDVTNTSDETDTPSYFYDISATQDDYELVETYASYDNSVPEEYNNSKYIRPGVTIRVVEEFSFKETGGIVKVSFYDYFEEDKANIVEFDPAKLSGAPKDEFKPQPIKDPKWTEGIKSEGELVYFDDEKFNVKIDGCDFTKDYDNNKLIRVYFNIKNLSPEEMSFSHYPYAYQDGIALSSGYPDDSVDEDDNNDVEIEPGKSIRVAYCFVLTSDSPIEVEFKDYDDNIIGAVFEVK